MNRRLLSEEVLREALQQPNAGRGSAVPPRRTSPSVIWAQAREARRRRGETQIAHVMLASQIAIGLLLLIPIAVVATMPAAQQVYATLRMLPWDVVAIAIGGLGATAALVRLASREMHES
jgi:hypothetical protein